MIQTESPYYQPVPTAPHPFTPGLFPNDPVFKDCTGGGCAFSWAVRIIDSSTIYVLGSGLYSWFTDYTQGCVDTDSCQQRGFEVVQSYDLWIYNLCTKAILEMVSPLGATPTWASDNVNGFLSSILAWLHGAEQTSGHRTFTGFQVYTVDDLDEMIHKYPDTCQTALTQVIECDDYVQTMLSLTYHGSLPNTTYTDTVCDSGCGASLKSWFDNVSGSCNGLTLDDGIAPTLLGGRMWAGYNETCLKDPQTGQYCNGKS